MKKRAFFIILTIVIVLLLCRMGLRYGEFKSVENATDISFDSRVSQIDIYDNYESFVVMHVKIHEDIDSFMARHNFTSDPAIVNFLQDWMAFLNKPENRSFPYDSDLRFMSGERWMCALDVTSGRLWIRVGYPDFAGD